MIRRFILLFIPFVLFSSQQTTLQLIEQSKLYNKNEWKALIHYSDNFNITDNKFLISKKKSLKNEMLTSLESFYDSKEKYDNINNHPQCKFPARLLFITNELNISKNEFPQIDCPDFQTYKEKAPADKIFLIYASEKVNNPSSMMGHTFLKYSGKNKLNKNAEHAVSFYTVIESINLLKLLYQNTFSGMKGMFALQPYKKVHEQYTKRENRNVWEYQLKLSDYKRKLIHYHIWELKDLDMQYFFTSYNCSTVIYYNLSLVNPKIYDDRKLWITPLDTVKFLYKYDLIQKSELLPSNKWLIKMLEENLDNTKVDNIKAIIDKQKFTDIKKLDFYSLKLLEAYSQLEYDKKHIEKDIYENIDKEIIKKSSQYNNIIDISHYKSPNKIPDERQLELGYSNLNENKYMKLSFLGASHLLNDNNKEYFGESELKIAYLSILLNKSELELSEFTLYGMKSYIPFDKLTKDLSYQFELSVKKEYSQQMNYLDTLKIDGGFGIDFLIAKDINIFAILNSGVGYNTKDNLHLFFNPEVGAMIYEIFNMKSFLSYNPLFINNHHIYNKYSLKHNLFFNKNWKLSANINSIKGKKDYLNYEFSIIKLF